MSAQGSVGFRWGTITGPYHANFSQVETQKFDPHWFYCLQWGCNNLFCQECTSVPSDCGRSEMHLTNFVAWHQKSDLVYHIFYVIGTVYKKFCIYSFVWDLINTLTSVAFSSLNLRLGE